MPLSLTSSSARSVRSQGPSRRLPACAAAFSLLWAGTALAQNSPYYIGVAQALAHESNIFRLADGAATPNGVKKADTVATTSLVAGFDQPIGRQRLYGNATLRSNQYASNDQLDNQGYSLNLGTDWSTINRISGKLDLNAQRNLRPFDPNEANRSKNVETATLVNAVARIGVVTRLTAEAGLSWRKVDYSRPEYSRAEYDQTGTSLAMLYRLGGVTNVGVRLRHARTDYFNVAGDERARTDLDLLADWTPSGLTKISGRLSYGNEDADLSSVPDFKGFSGDIQGNWQATGKVNLSARLSHDTGQESAFQDISSTSRLFSDFSRTTTSLSLGANYAFSSKVNFTAGLSVSKRDLKNSFSGANLAFANVGDDTTTGLSLGARWQPTRAISLGCDFRHENRSASGVNNNGYDNNAFSCFGQLILQGL